MGMFPLLWSILLTVARWAAHARVKGDCCIGKELPSRGCEIEWWFISVWARLIQAAAHWFNKSLSTAPALASADTGTGVNVGRESEMGFISRWPPEVGGATRGTASERGARKGLDSLGLFPTAATPVRTEVKAMWLMSKERHIPERCHEPLMLVYLQQRRKHHRLFFWKVGRSEAWCHGPKAWGREESGWTRFPGTSQTSQRRTVTTKAAGLSGEFYFLTLWSSILVKTLLILSL